MNIRLRILNRQFIANNFLLLLLLLVSVILSGFRNRDIAILSILLSFILFIVLLWKLLVIKNITWLITNEQIIYKKGVFFKTTDYLELYRIFDFVEQQSFLQQIISTKTIILVSGDKSNPRLKIFGISKSNNVLNVIRIRVEDAKKKNKIYEITNR